MAQESGQGFCARRDCCCGVNREFAPAAIDTAVEVRRGYVGGMTGSKSALCRARDIISPRIGCLLCVRFAGKAKPVNARVLFGCF